MKIGGLVVAGGQSQRMGEENKLLLELGGEALVLRAVRRLAQQVDTLAININEDIEILSDTDYPILADQTGTGEGPLAGILAGLNWLNDNHADKDYLLTIPADAPFFPEDIAHLLAVNEPMNRIIVPFLHDFSQPLFALWPITSIDALDEFLRSGTDRKVMNFIQSQYWRRVELPRLAEHAFLNVNTIEDWQKAKAIFDEGSDGKE